MIEDALEELDRCISSLDAGDDFAADDMLMACKRTFSEMLMFRSVSDAIGLLTLKLFQAASVGVVIDNPQLPRIFKPLCAECGPRLLCRSRRHAI